MEYVIEMELVCGLSIIKIKKIDHDKMYEFM